MYCTMFMMFCSNPSNGNVWFFFSKIIVYMRIHQYNHKSFDESTVVKEQIGLIILIRLFRLTDQY